MKNFLNRSYEVLGSRKLFYIVIAFFVFEALWIALSAVYPMAFDEEFHFGLIKVYSHYWLPFLSNQPPNANAYGAVARDPSYLYHYLMSYPYRFITLFTKDQTTQIILLRFINIGFFGMGLVLFRRVLLRAKMSQALTNVSMILFILIPITPQLAAQINYDNLLFLLVAWTCLLTFDVCDGIIKNKPNIKTIITLLTVCLLSTLVKYAFLPIFLAVVIFSLFLAERKYRHKYTKLFVDLWESWKKHSYLMRILLIVMLIVSCGLFLERDGYNLVKYHSFTPDCSKVLSIKQCSAYSAWYSDYLRHQWVVNNAEAVSFDNPVLYMLAWVYWIGYRLFFAVNGVNSDYTNYPPLPLPIAAAILIAVGGVIAIFVWKKRIFHNNPYLAFFFVASILYLVSLWIDGYTSYRYTDTLVAMNGRYLLPVLLLIAAVMGKALSMWIGKSGKSKLLKPAFALIVILFFLEGGGFLTFIARSDSTWDWPNTTVVRVNDAARKVTHPVLISGKKNYDTSIWVFN